MNTSATHTPADVSAWATAGIPEFPPDYAAYLTARSSFFSRLPAAEGNAETDRVDPPAEP